ncbi:MAG: shikimate kinase [Synechococcaceae cyanobacterium ELA739]|jgi:shikimate kinase
MAGAPLSAGELAQRLQGLNLYLVGMMGAGKSAVARPLAEVLGYRVIDADSVIEATAGRPIPEIFASDGESGFRTLETAVLDSIAHWHSLVVATGGGVVTQPPNWGHLHQGVVIWLDAPQELLLERLLADSTARPLLGQADPAERLSTLLAERRPLYGQADLTVLQQAGESPSQIAQRVLEALPSILHQRQQAPEAPAQLLDRDGRPTQSLN